jgi:hypothetical protein
MLFDKGRTMQSKTFRLFISSTFNDFRREREVLQTNVFPHIKEYCSKKGYVFQPIDLRWGVSEEAQLDQKTLELCLDEVRTCKAYPHPNFLVMLGDRYGWVPLPYMIESNEFNKIVKSISKNEKELLLKWYKEDLNQIPPSYILQERTGEYRDFKKWEQEENALRDILQNGAKKADLSSEQIRKYFISATEAEIEEGIIPYIKPTKHQQKLIDKNPNLLEIDPKYIVGFFRDIDTNSKKSDIFIANDYDKAQSLKDRVKKELLEKNTLNAKTKQIDNNKLDESYLDEFEKEVIRFLKEKVDEHVQKEQHFSPLEIELQAQDYFAKEKRKNFLAQKDCLNAISNYTNNNNLEPFVLYGKSGIGKSSIMAKAIQNAKERGLKKVVYRFVGATPNSSSTKEIFISIFEELGLDIRSEQEKAKKKSDLTNNLEQKQETFEEFCYRVNSEIMNIKDDVVIFIDAIDQITHNDEFLWLPNRLPSNVKIVISALDDINYKEDSRFFNKLKQKTKNLLEVKPFDRPLELLHKLLQENSRTLQKEQEEYFLKQYKNASTPLYILVATQELKHWRSYDGLENRPKNGKKIQKLANTQKGIIREFISNLHTFYHHDKELIRRVFGYIYSSCGLSESEIIQLLSIDNNFIVKVAPNTFHQNKDQNLPIVLWTRLYMQIKPFLSLKTESKKELFYFFHREFESIIVEENRQKYIHNQFIKSIQDIILKLMKSSNIYDRWDFLHIMAIVEYILRYKQKKDIANEMNFILSLGRDQILLYINKVNTIGLQKSFSNKIQEAIVYYEYAIHISKKYKLDKSTKDLLVYLKTLERLSTLYWNINRENEAMILKKEYYTLAKKIYFYDSNNSKYAEEYAKAMYKLSILYKTLGKFKEERKLREKTFYISKKLYEKNKSKWTNFYASSLLYLAASYKRGRRYLEAVKLGEEAINLRKELYKKSFKKWANPYASALQETAILYKAKGEVDIAIKYTKKSVAIREKLFCENPRKHVIGYTIGLSNLSIYYREIKDYTKALELGKICFQIRKKFYHEDPDRWSGYFAEINAGLGRTYRAMGKLNIAIVYLEKSLKVRKYIYGKAPKKWAKSYGDILGTLAKTYKQNKEYIKALELGLLSLNIRKNLYKENKKNRARGYGISLNLLAEIYIETNKIDEAYKYAYMSYKLRKKYFNYFQTNKWKKYYASGLLTLSKCIKDTDKAIELMTESVQLRQELYEMQGDIRKEFYLSGLMELSKLYRNKNMMKEFKSIEIKIKELES